MTVRTLGSRTPGQLSYPLARATGKCHRASTAECARKGASARTEILGIAGCRGKVDPWSVLTTRPMASVLCPALATWTSAVRAAARTRAARAVEGTLLHTVAYALLGGRDQIVTATWTNACLRHVRTVVFVSMRFMRTRARAPVVSAALPAARTAAQISTSATHSPACIAAPALTQSTATHADVEPVGKATTVR